MRRLTVIFPGLFDLVANENPETFAREYPKLSRLFDRGVIEQDKTLDFERTVIRNFGIDLDDQATINYVELSAAVDEIPFSKRLVRADPIHLRADGTQLRLFSGPYFEPDTDESEQLLAELRPIFPEYAFRRGRFSGRWYVEFPDSVYFEARSPLTIQQLTIEERLPTGSDAKKAHVFMNEIQMALHQTQVNRRRESRGEPAINSVWLWGLGQSLAAGMASGVSVWGEDVVAQALAQRYNLDSHGGEPHTISAKKVLGEPWVNAHKLVLLNHPCGPIATRREPVDLAAFEQVWAVSLCNALARGQLGLLEILDTRRKLRVSTFDYWKFWRHSNYFAEHREVKIDPTKLSRDISIDDT